MADPTTPAAAPNRLLLILGIGFGVLLLVFLLSQLLGGDDDTEPTATAPPVTSPTTVPTPTTLPPEGLPEETFETFNTKNPFVPLRIIGGGAGGGGGAAPAAGGTTTPGGGPAPAGGTAPAGATAPGGTTTGTADGGAGSASSATARTGGGGTEPRRGARVALLDVFAADGKTVANVRVNDTVYKVSDGQVFATNFKVVSLSQGEECGRFVFGDDSFRLCKGEETLK